MLCTLLCLASFTQGSYFEVGLCFWCGLVLFTVVCCPIVWMYCNVFSHFPVDGFWDCFQFEAIMNKAAVNVYVPSFVLICFSALEYISRRGVY